MPMPLRLPKLRSFFGRLVLTGLPLAGVGAGVGGASCSCPDPTDQILYLTSPGPDLQALIDRCTADGADCTDLCDAAIEMLEGPGMSDGMTVSHCELHAPVDGVAAVHVVYRPECIGGRRPASLARGDASARGATVGHWLADLARLEAASVPAFLHLARELEAHHAPRALRRAAVAAARDEVRHAAQTAALARRYGATPRAARIDPVRVRPLAEVAAENAAEGCVREAFGALVATWQSRAASDPVVRAVMSGIAADETRHAAVALDVHAWATGRIDASARARVDDARDRAVSDLLRTLERDPPAELVLAAGVPRARDARRLGAALRESLWA